MSVMMNDRIEDIKTPGQQRRKEFLSRVGDEGRKVLLQENHRSMFLSQ